MAGIGFELQKLMKSGGILGQLGAIGHGAVIAAGPWIFTILAIALITLTTEGTLGRAALAEFRVNIIYAFALSLLATAPIVIVATRMVSDAIYAKKYQVISHLFFAALAFGGFVSTLVTLLLYGLVFTLSITQLLTGVIACSLVGMIWVAMAFCSAVRDFRGITIAFATGLVIAVTGGIIATIYEQATPGLVWTFNIGLSVTLFLLISRVLLTFPDPIISPGKALATFARAGTRHWHMALAAIISVAAIWIDKWVMWLGPAGESLPAGFIHAPIYDSAMFVAYLVIIPALSLFIIDLETDFFVSYQRYYADIKAHATLQQVRENAADVTDQTHRSLQRILIIQATLCAILVLLSPLIIESLGMQYRQTSILRLGTVGALFQFLFLASSSLLLFFNRNRQFFYLQLLFLTLNATLTYVTMHMGEEYYGFGYLVACLIASLFSIATLDRALRELTYHTFMLATTQSDEKHWLAEWS